MRNITERRVLDPITHLPLLIHDVSDIELDQISPPLSADDLRTRANERDRNNVQSNLQAEMLSNKRHSEIERIVHETTHKAWWSPVLSSSHEKNNLRLRLLIASSVGLVSGLFVGYAKRMGSIGSTVVFCQCCLLVCLSILALSSKLSSARVEHKTHPEVDKTDIHTERKVDVDPLASCFLNNFLQHMWPVLNPSLFLPFSSTLEDFLQTSLETCISSFHLMRGVRITDVVQGTEPIRVLGVRCLDVGGDPCLSSENVQDLKASEGTNFVNLELALAYRGRVQFPLDNNSNTDHGHSSGFYFLLDVSLLPGLTFPVRVDVTSFLSTLRLRLRLLPSSPFFSPIRLTFLGKPKIAIKCTPLLSHGRTAPNYLNVVDIPGAGLSKWIKRNMYAIIDQYIAPNCLDFNSNWTEDVRALGAVVITIRGASIFMPAFAGEELKRQESRIRASGDTRNLKGSIGLYVTLRWKKLGKVIWSTRVIKRENCLSPVWEETTAVLVKPEEVEAHEELRVQLWGIANRWKSDNLLGLIDIPLSSLMNEPETINRISVREDQLHNIDHYEHPHTNSGMQQQAANPNPQLHTHQLLWECGYFSKTAPEQPAELEPKRTGEEKQRERGVLYHCAEEWGLLNKDQKTPDNQPQTDSTDISTVNHMEKDKGIVSPKPQTDFPSGVLSIQIECISGLGVQNPSNARPEADSIDDTALPSAYCTVLINHQKAYRTRTKMKNNNPLFHASSEHFIRNWRDTTIVIAIQDNRDDEYQTTMSSETSAQGKPDRKKALDPILGVVVLPLSDIFRGSFSYINTLPIVGGTGYGWLKFGLLFHSVQVQLPRRLLGWDAGTIAIQPKVYAVENKVTEGGDNSGDALGGKYPSDLANCRLEFRTAYGKTKMNPYHPTHYQQHQREKSSSATALPASLAPNAVAEWRPKIKTSKQSKSKDVMESPHKPIRLPVLKRYASCLHIQFHLRRRGVLGPELILAECTLWLKDIPDEDEVVVQLPIWKMGPKTGGCAENEVTGGAIPLTAIASRGKKVRTNDNVNESPNVIRNRVGTDLFTELEEGGIGSHAAGAEVIPNVMLTFRIRFWHGLRGYHQPLVEGDANLKEVMNILECAEEQKNVTYDLLRDDFEGDDFEESVSDSEEERSVPVTAEAPEEEASTSASPENQRKSQHSRSHTRTFSQHTRSSSGKRAGEDNDVRMKRLKEEEDAKEKQKFEEDAKAESNKPKEMQARKHRGKIQWKSMRHAMFDGVEEKVERLGQKIKHGLQHQNRLPGRSMLY